MCANIYVIFSCLFSLFGILSMKHKHADTASAWPGLSTSVTGEAEESRPLLCTLSVMFDFTIQCKNILTLSISYFQFILRYWDVLLVSALVFVPWFPCIGGCRAQGSDACSVPWHFSPNFQIIQAKMS